MAVTHLTPTALTETAVHQAYEILVSECRPIGHMNCLRVSLHTLASQQSDLGAIPNNVSVATGRPMGYPHQAWSAGTYVRLSRLWRDLNRQVAKAAKIFSDSLRSWRLGVLAVEVSR